MSHLDNKAAILHPEILAIAVEIILYPERKYAYPNVILQLAEEAIATLRACLSGTPVEQGLEISLRNKLLKH